MAGQARLRAVERWSGVAAIVVLIALALHVTVTTASWLVHTGPDGYGSAAAAAYDLSQRTAGPLLAVSLAAILGTAVLLRPEDPAPRRLAVAGVVVEGVAAALLAALILVWAVPAPPAQLVDVVDPILLLALHVLAIALLATILSTRAPDEEATALPAVPPVGPAAPPPVEPARQPTWRPDVATGQVWLTAGDAATGAPASPWAPDAKAAEPPDPDRPSDPTSAPTQPRHPWWGSDRPT